MTVKTVPTKFETSDGKEFDTKEEAERHDELILARKAYKDARHTLGVILARSQKTADGVPFDFSLLRDYYYISDGWASLPALRRVSFYIWNFEFDERDVFEIKQWDERGKGEQMMITYKINELYYSEREAKKALLDAQEAWLAEEAQKVAALRAEVHPSK